MIETLLGLLRASREGNWKFHLASVRAMIPWCFAYNNVNYARYLPAYLAEMSHLHNEHPEIHEHFESGYFLFKMARKTLLAAFQSIRPVKKPLIKIPRR